ncbi:MAG TPA: hypothetical protein VHR16_07730 [Candidatus Limnocylindrales bacterium]|nr:hypothetical protein [Candidatus Limnocylindrales bacterium]
MGHGNAGQHGMGQHGMGQPADLPTDQEETGHGRSEWSPGHQKRDAGAQSARDFAPGHQGDPAGETPRDDGQAAVEQPEPDSIERES